MSHLKKYSIAIILLIIIMGASSCGLFKGKNKCGDCPTWSQKEAPANSQKTVNV